MTAGDFSGDSIGFSTDPSIREHIDCAATGEASPETPK